MCIEAEVMLIVEDILLSQIRRMANVTGGYMPANAEQYMAPQSIIANPAHLSTLQRMTHLIADFRRALIGRRSEHGHIVLSGPARRSLRAFDLLDGLRQVARGSPHHHRGLLGRVRRDPLNDLGGLRRGGEHHHVAAPRLEQRQEVVPGTAQLARFHRYSITGCTKHDSCFDHLEITSSMHLVHKVC